MQRKTETICRAQGKMSSAGKQGCREINIRGKSFVDRILHFVWCFTIVLKAVNTVQESGVVN